MDSSRFIGIYTYWHKNRHTVLIKYAFDIKDSNPIKLYMINPWIFKNRRGQKKYKIIKNKQAFYSGYHQNSISRKARIETIQPNKVPKLILHI